MGDNGDENGWGTGNRQGGIPQVIVKAAVKERLDSHNVSAGFYDELNRKTYDMIQQASERAEENGRKTVQPRDL